MKFEELYEFLIDEMARAPEKENDDLREEVLRMQLVMREVLSMFVNLGAIGNNNIVLRFSDDVDAETVYDDITKKMGDCLPNAKGDSQSPTKNL